jgi:hypothetical protein
VAYKYRRHNSDILPTIALQEIESQLAAESRSLMLIFPALSHGELLFSESDQKFLIQVVTMRSILSDWRSASSHLVA